MTFICLKLTLKYNSMTSIGRNGADIGFVIFLLSIMMSTIETLKPARAGIKIQNIFDA
jgi:hypothetical protein